MCIKISINGTTGSALKDKIISFKNFLFRFFCVIFAQNVTFMKKLKYNTAHSKSGNNKEERDLLVKIIQCAQIGKFDKFKSLVMEQINLGTCIEYVFEQLIEFGLSSYLFQIIDKVPKDVIDRHILTACRYNRIDILKIMALKKANFKEYGEEAMYLASELGNLDTVKFLISCGIDDRFAHFHPMSNVHKYLNNRSLTALAP